MKSKETNSISLPYYHQSNTLRHNFYVWINKKLEMEGL